MRKQEETNARSDAEEIADLNKTIERLMWEREAFHSENLKLKAEVKALQHELVGELV